jgi:hypothetical protein
MTAKPEEDGGEPETAHEPGAEAPPLRLSCNSCVPYLQGEARTIARLPLATPETGDVAGNRSNLHSSAETRISRRFAWSQRLLAVLCLPSVASKEDNTTQSSSLAKIYESWIKPPLWCLDSSAVLAKVDRAKVTVLRLFSGYASRSCVYGQSLALAGWKWAFSISPFSSFLTSPMRVSAALFPVSLAPQPAEVNTRIESALRGELSISFQYRTNTSRRLPFTIL